MKDRRILVLPGVSSPIMGRYEQVYALILEEAKRNSFDCRILCYPGQKGEKSGLLCYSSAIRSALLECQEFSPNWIIGRSFGCVIAVGLLNSQEAWIDTCEGAVLWGPVLNTTIDHLFPTPERKQEEVEGYKAWDTFLATDFFDTVPLFENLIRTTRCDLRLVRGSRDEYNIREELNHLAAIHRRMQPDYIREVIEIRGLRHSVVRDDTSPELLTQYSDALFNPINAEPDFLGGVTGDALPSLPT